MTWAEIQQNRVAYEAKQTAERVRREMWRALLDYLTRCASDPDRIGRRVLLVRHLLQEDVEFGESQLSLANKLGVSEARVSAALNEIRDFLEGGKG